MNMKTNSLKFRIIAKENIGYFFAFLSVVICIIAASLTVPFNIDSIYDEGFHYLFLQDALNGTINGISQWANMIVALLPSSICTSVLALRIIGLCLPICTSIVFCLLTQKIAVSTKEKIIYFIMVFFLIIPSVGGIMVCYNEISQCLLLTSCATLYRLCYDTNRIRNSIWAGFTGFLLAVSLFSIFPSAVILCGCSIFLICIRYWKKWTDLVLYLLCGIIGISIALLLVHLFVADLYDIIQGMKATTKTVTTVSRGYDPISFILKILLFIRDFAFCTFVILGIYAIGNVIARWSKILAIITFIISILLYYHYQIKPQVAISMIMTSLWLIPIYQKSIETNVSFKNIMDFETIFMMFLICYPLLASIGTNVYIGSKMSYFLIPWVLLLWKLDFVSSKSLSCNGGLIAISIILLLSAYSSFQAIDYSKNRVEYGGFKGLYMTDTQEKHYCRVDSILSLYNFRRNESVVYTTQLSMVTLAYMEGVPCGVFFQPTDFVCHASEVKCAPDFLFMCKYDENAAGETLKHMNWGWPDEFDKYYIGTPETVDVGYPTERWLYCRKSLKN